MFSDIATNDKYGLKQLRAQGKRQAEITGHFKSGTVIIQGYIYLTLFVMNNYFFGRGPNRIMETACFDANVQ